MREIETFKGLDYLAEIKKLNITMTGDYNHICSFFCDEIIFLSSNWILTCRYNISFKGHNLCTSRIWSEIKRLTKTWHVIGCWPLPPPHPSKSTPNPKSVTPQSSNFLHSSPPTGNGCFCFFTYGYFQQAHPHIFEAIITD